MQRTYVMTFVVFLLITAHPSRAEEIFLNSEKVSGDVILMDGPNIMIRVDKGAVKSVDGLPVDEYEAEWKKQKQQDGSQAGKDIRVLYEEMMADRPAQDEIDILWQVIEKQKTVAAEYDASFLENEGNEHFTRDDVFRLWGDDQQKILGLIRIDEDALQLKTMFFMKVGPEVWFKFSEHSVMQSDSDIDDAKALLKDEDQDGLPDKDEDCADQEIFSSALPCQATDAQNADTDGDGWWDGIEKAAHVDPTDPDDVPDMKRWFIEEE